MHDRPGIAQGNPSLASPRSLCEMATGVNGTNIGVQAMKEGTDNYVLKPFHLDAVVASVRRALDKKRLELEVDNYRQNLEQMVKDRTKQLQAAMKRIEMT
jgi:DNA-binding NtrC family response regulator